MKENSILVDTSIIISQLHGSLSLQAKNILKKRKTAMSVISFFETCRYYAAAGRATYWNDVKAELAEIEVLYVSKEIAEMAAALSAQKGLSVADALIYATAQQNGLILATSDNHFAGLKGVLLLK